jgi:putative DNA methylase
LLAVVAEGPRSRVYLSAGVDQEAHALAVPHSDAALDAELSLNRRHSTPPDYGMTTFADLFTSRQLAALITISDLVGEGRERVHRGAMEAGDRDPAGYADAVATYLAFAVDKHAEYNCTLVPWYSKEDRPKGLFARQALPMLWDYAEVNPLGDIGGTLVASVRVVSEAIEAVPLGAPARRSRHGDSEGCGIDRWCGGTGFH